MRVFNSITEAEQSIGKQEIRNQIIGKNKTCDGFHWKYFDD